MIQSEIISVPHSVYCNFRVGTYGIAHRKGINWITCRDSFHYHYGRCKKGFFFCHSEIELLSEFIGTIEKRLGLDKLTKFYKTDKKDIVYVCPARFWLWQTIRFSLFSILLRGATLYTAGLEIEKVFDMQSYLSETRPAVDRFLAGYTRYTGWRSGWVDQFHYHHGDEQTLLVRPWLIWPIRGFVRLGQKLRKLGAWS